MNWQPLFNHMDDTHKLVLTETEMHDIADAVDKSMALSAIDDYGNNVQAGDFIEFSCGIPPVNVVAQVVQCGRQLVALTSGHNPTQCNIKRLRKLVGGWIKHEHKNT